jgi:hypothetical protein
MEERQGKKESTACEMLDDVIKNPTTGMGKNASTVHT